MKYDDIIDMTPILNHQRMSMDKRAAQFSPFAALTGYEDAILEENRLTDDMPELSQDVMEEISSKLNEALSFNKKITIIYFVKDLKKSGGNYNKHSGQIKRIDLTEGLIIFNDKTKIIIDNIVKIIDD